MSQSLPQYSKSNFPNALESYIVFTDINSSNKQYVDQYYTYLNSSNFESANQVLIDHPELKYVIINANTMQTIFDSIMAIETFVSSETFYEKLGGIVKDKGDYNATVQYELWNIVYYNGLAYMVTGNNGVKPPIGTLPSNISYFKQLSIIGASGSGMAFYTTYNSTQSYKKLDAVPYVNRLWVSLVDNNLGNQPDISPDDWTSVVTVPTQIITSNNQPTGQDATGYWYQSNSTDDSIKIKKSNGDGTYTQKYPESNASFIITTNGSNVQAKLDTAASTLSTLTYGLNWKTWNIHVNDDGDDVTGDGTSAKPFRTINKAMEVYPHPCLTITVGEGRTLTISDPIYISNRQLNIAYEYASNAANVIIDNNIYLVNSSISFHGVIVSIGANGYIRPTGTCSVNIGGYYAATLQLVSGVTAPKAFCHISNSDLTTDGSFQCDFLAVNLHKATIRAGINLVAMANVSAKGSPIVLYRQGTSVVIESGAYLYNGANNKDQLGTSQVYVLR